MKQLDVEKSVGVPYVFLPAGSTIRSSLPTVYPVLAAEGFELKGQGFHLSPTVISTSNNFKEPGGAGEKSLSPNHIYIIAYFFKKNK
jgi:hypothetical protein